MDIGAFSVDFPNDWFRTRVDDCGNLTCHQGRLWLIAKTVEFRQKLNRIAVFAIPTSALLLADRLTAPYSIVQIQQGW